MFHKFKVVVEVKIAFMGLVEVSWSESEARDHCLCKECLHEETRQRLLDTFSVSVGSEE